MMLGSVYADGHARNSFFSEDDPTHKFNPTHTPRALRAEFAKRGIELNTADMNEGRKVDFELHFEGRALAESKVPRFLVALENPHLNPLNADTTYFEKFRRVFSWDRRFLSLPNVQEIAYGIHFVVPSWPAFDQRDIFSCLINANKRFVSELPNDLYVERLSVIRWHERHAPNDFDLYGLGWDKPTRGSGMKWRVRRRAQRLATQLFGYRPFPSWRGEVPGKADILLRTKFSYCYENVHSLTGYVTEKIFDSLMNGCVPVYWGADDVERHVPPECFIDRRRFADTAEVHSFLRSMTAQSYARKQQSISDFLGSSAARKFSSEGFAEAIAQGVQGAMQSDAAQPGKPPKGI